MPGYNHCGSSLGLLRVQAFISNHNPTQVDAQGMDRGTQYRSGIYTHTADQKTAARDFLSQAQSRFQVRHPPHIGVLTKTSYTMHIIVKPGQTQRYFWGWGGKMRI